MVTIAASTWQRPVGVVAAGQRGQVDPHDVQRDAGQQREEAVAHAVVVHAQPHAAARAASSSGTRAADEVSSVSSVMREHQPRPAGSPPAGQRVGDLLGQPLGGHVARREAHGDATTSSAARATSAQAERSSHSCSAAVAPCRSAAPHRSWPRTRP